MTCFTCTILTIQRWLNLSDRYGNLVFWKINARSHVFNLCVRCARSLVGAGGWRRARQWLLSSLSSPPTPSLVRQLSFALDKTRKKWYWRADCFICIQDIGTVTSLHPVFKNGYVWSNALEQNFTFIWSLYCYSFRPGSQSWRHKMLFSLLSWRPKSHGTFAFWM